MINKDFFNILSSFINGSGIDNVSNFDWAEISHLTEVNDVMPVVYIALKDYEAYVPEQYMDKLKKVFLKTVTYSGIRGAVAQYLCTLLSNNQIEHFLVKGMVVKDYYPIPEVRTMGDIDVIVRPEDFDKASKILEENNFIYSQFESDTNVRDYVKSNVMIELHQGMIFKNSIPGVKAMEYFEKPFNMVEDSQDNTKIIKKEYHFIYLLVHMAKHFMNGGFGVRMLMDIPLFVNKYRDTANWDMIKDELVKLKMLEFAKVVFRMCNVVFALEPPCNIGQAESSEAEIYKILDYLISGGVFGFEGRNEDAIRISQGTADVTGFKGTLLRVRDIVRWIFPSYKYMSQKYDWFKNKPAIFLPLGWIYCIWYRMFKNRENSLSRIKNVAVSGKDVKEHHDITKLMGFGKNNLE